MSLGACIPGLVEQGEMTPEQGEEMRGLYDSLTAQYLREYGQDTAAAMATEATLKEMDKRVLARREQAGRTIKARQEQTANMASYGGGRGIGDNGGPPLDPGAGPAFLVPDDRASYSSVGGRWASIRRRSLGAIDKALAKFSTNLAGFVRNRATLLDMTREAFGEDSGNVAAKEIFKAWQETAEWLRKKFNAAGGSIGYLKDWGLPQVHNWTRIRDAGVVAWKAFLLGDQARGIPGKLNREAMIDEHSGLPITDQRLDAALDLMWRRGVSGGAIEREPGDAPDFGILANARNDQRFLKFAGADAWTEYAARFGQGDAFRAMMLHINHMARDIAMLEILGPNPEAGIRFIKDSLQNSADRDLSAGSKASGKARAAGRKMDRLWNELTGASMVPDREWLAKVGGGFRVYQVISKMGGAALSAVSDLAFGYSTRRYNGLPVMSLIPDYIRFMALPSQRQAAIRDGLIGEEWTEKISSGHAALGEELSGEVLRRTASGVVRAQGLALITDAGRMAYGKAVLSEIANRRGLRFDQLAPKFGRMWQRNGIDAAGWDQIRATPLVRDKGVGWLQPQRIENEALGLRLLELIDRDTNIAVPTPGIETRSLINAAAPPGTIRGEILRSMGTFKSFGIETALTQANRIAALGLGGGFRYAAGLVGATTVMGGVVLLLKDLAAGRDPRAMFDEDGRLSYSFWGQATLTGGGWTIAGDFLRSTESRSGGGIGNMLMGPVLSDGELLWEIANSGATGRAAMALTGRGDSDADTILGQGWQRRAFKLARSNTPLGSMWYARLAFDRQVADQLQMATDPDYNQSWQRMEKWADEQGSGYYWAPGDSYEDARAPNFANIGTPALSDPEKLVGLK